MPKEKTPKGFEVPIPRRGEFFANLKKVAKVPRKPSGGSDSTSGTEKK
jgi:hypothetical protein